jgi:hypothetical protein
MGYIDPSSSDCYNGCVNDYYTLRHDIPILDTVQNIITHNVSEGQTNIFKKESLDFHSFLVSFFLSFFLFLFPFLSLSLSLSLLSCPKYFSFFDLTQDL